LAKSLKQATTASFHILRNSRFTARITFDAIEHEEEGEW
jgi:hypothetical protein